MVLREIFNKLLALTDEQREFLYALLMSQKFESQQILALLEEWYLEVSKVD